VLYRVIDDLACRVAKESGPDIAMRFHPGAADVAAVIGTPPGGRSEGWAGQPAYTKRARLMM
jgi:hypothetical protein